MVSVGAVAAVLVVVLALGGLIAKWATEDSVPVASAIRPTPPPRGAPTQTSPNDTRRDSPTKAPSARFPSDDRGFIDSSARCQDTQPAFAIGRTVGSLVVICGEEPGQYEYLGVRLSDAAMLRANAQTDAARGFLAQKAGVLYAVSPAELTVTAGSTVIKREPMIEYRALSR